MKLTKGKNRLVIIGNSAPSRDFTPEIKDTDLVLRFNKMDKLGTGLIGYRTDIIVLVANWSLRHYCFRGRMDPFRMRHFQTVKEVWMRDSESISDTVKNTILKRLRVTDKPMIKISGEETEDIMSDLVYDTPSTGFLILKKIKDQNLFPDLEKCICALDSSYKRQHHSMGKERRIINDWIEQGHFKRL